MGAMTFVKVMQSPQRVEALRRAGRDFASPMSALVLVDTGASSTCLDRQLIFGLGLEVRGVASIHTPSTSAAYEQRNLFDACVVLGEGQANPLVTTLPVIESDFAVQGFLGILAGTSSATAS